MVQRFSGRNEFEVCKKEERSQCGPNVEGSGDKNDFFLRIVRFDREMEG